MRGYLLLLSNCGVLSRVLLQSIKWYNLIILISRHFYIAHVLLRQEVILVIVLFLISFHLLCAVNQAGRILAFGSTGYFYHLFDVCVLLQHWLWRQAVVFWRCLFLAGSLHSFCFPLLEFSFQCFVFCWDSRFLGSLAWCWDCYLQVGLEWYTCRSRASIAFNQCVNLLFKLSCFSNCCGQVYRKLSALLSTSETSLWKPGGFWFFRFNNI